MKKLYLFFTLLLSLLGATTAFAQDEVTLTVDMDHGKWVEWNGVESSPYARTWNSTTTPAISICCKNGSMSTTDIRGNNFTGANNMAAWGDGLKQLTFFNQFSATGFGNYEIMVDFGWYIKSVDFDFNSSVDAGTGVALFDGDEVISEGPEDTQHVSAVTDGDETYAVPFTVYQKGTNGFARTSNFYVVVAKQPEAKAALAELQNTLATYQDYYFVTGSEPGNYGEAEYKAFRDAINAAYDAEGNPDLDDMSDAEKTALYRQLEQTIKDTYEAVLASRNTVITVADGYYRLRAGMTYTAQVKIGEDEDGEDITEQQEVEKYMFSTLEGETIYGRWGSSSDKATDCSILWKVTNKDGAWDVENMGTDSRFNNVATSTSVTMALNSENLLTFEPVATVEGQTYANIRVSTQETGKTFYLHQGSHGSGAGTGSYLVGWSSSATTNEEGFHPGPTEWVLEAVDAAEAEAIIKAYEPEKENLLMKERYKLMVPDALDKLEIAHDRSTTVSEEALIHDAEQFSSPASDREEGTDFGALLDGDVATIWHGDWHNDFKGDVQYIRVELTDADVTAAALTFTRRNTTANQITQWTVYGTNDPEAGLEESERLAILNTPYTAAAEVITTKGFLTNGYKYLLFAFTGNTSGAKYAHFAEFQLYKATVTESATSQFNVLGDVAKNLENVVKAQEKVDVDELTAEQYNAMKTAYDAFIEKFVDPTELRETLADVQGAAEGVVKGTQPGYWAEDYTPTGLASTVEKAQAYDAAGAYTQEQSDKLVEELKAQAEAIFAAAIQIQEGKWYRIRFAAEEDFDAHEWNKNAGYVAPDEGEPEIDAPLFGKYVSIADYTLVDSETGEYSLDLFDKDDAVLGEDLFFLADQDITDKDMSLFRFIAVGDSAYVIQNKATDLFLKTTSGAALVTVNLHPSLFNVSAVGYGLNVVAAKSLTGDAHNYLHGQKQYNVLVTWNASTPGSASALYIEEAGDVAADYANEANVGVVYGALNAFCYPVEISSVAEGQAWSVTAAEANKVTLVKIADKIDAGRPFIYINGEVDDYDEEEEAEPIAFTINPTAKMAIEPQTEGILKGTYSSLVLDRGDIYCSGNALVVNTVEKDAIMVTLTRVNANGAYIEGDGTQEPNAEVELVWDEESADGIQTALTKVAKSGIIYTLDGRVAGKGNLNEVKNLGKGIYILNGIKVLVK